MTEIVKQVSAQLAFEEGIPVLRVGTTFNLVADEVVELYAGDYCLATAPLIADIERSDELVAQFEDFDPPLLEFPTHLRAALSRNGEELSSGIELGDVKALLAALAPPVMRAQLSEIGPDRLGFEVHLDKLVDYPRWFSLFLDGREAGSALATQHHGTAGVQKLIFSIPAPLRNGTLIELIDTATGLSIFMLSASWMNLVWPIALKAQALETDLELCRKEIKELNARLALVLDLDRDRLLLERLDLFHFLLNTRIDRITHAREPVLEPHPVPGHHASASLEVRPRALEGVGFHNLEVSGQNEWRWFGPKVLLAFRALDGRPTRVVLSFFQFAHEASSPEIRVSVNDAEVGAVLSNPEPNQYLLDIPVLPAMWRSDHTLLVQLQFPDHESQEDDRRHLSAVFNLATLFLERAAGS